MNDSNCNVYVCEEVREVQRLHHDLFTDKFRQMLIFEQLDRQAGRLVDAHRSGDTAVVTHFKCWHPDLVGRSVTEIMTYDVTLEDARQTIAREYGYADWADAHHRGNHPTDHDFETAVDTVLSGDADGLCAMLKKKPTLIHARSGFGHRATLLHYCGSNGVETYRQVVPYNLAEIVQILVDAGADVNATAEIYGGGCATLALLTSSSHPAAIGIVNNVVKVLMIGGADCEF